MPRRESPAGNAKTTQHEQVSLVAMARLEGQDLEDGTEALVDPVKESLCDYCGISYTVAAVQKGTGINQILDHRGLVGNKTQEGRKWKRRVSDFGGMCGDKLSSQQKR